MNKKGTEILTEQIIFIVLNLLFFAILMFFVMRLGSANTVAEEIYAKKIGLILDNMRPGMEVNLSAEDFFSRIEKNQFKNFPITISGNVVNVKVVNGVGYSFSYFSKVNPQISINKNENIITITT